MLKLASLASMMAGVAGVVHRLSPLRGAMSSSSASGGRWYSRRSGQRRRRAPPIPPTAGDRRSEHPIVGPRPGRRHGWSARRGRRVSGRVPSAADGCLLSGPPSAARTTGAAGGRERLRGRAGIWNGHRDRRRFARPPACRARRPRTGSRPALSVRSVLARQRRSAGGGGSGAGRKSLAIARPRQPRRRFRPRPAATCRARAECPRPSPGSEDQAGAGGRDQRAQEVGDRPADRAAPAARSTRLPRPTAGDDTPDRRPEDGQLPVPVLPVGPLQVVAERDQQRAAGATASIPNHGAIRVALQSVSWPPWSSQPDEQRDAHEHQDQADHPGSGGPGPGRRGSSRRRRRTRRGRVLRLAAERLEAAVVRVAIYTSTTTGKTSGRRRVCSYR